jgi:ABC-type Mn2+/Zn2+ transport system permease subunit
VVLGLFVSDWADIASGATIVMVMFGFFLAAFTFSPRRAWLRKLLVKKQEQGSSNSMG